MFCKLVVLSRVTDVDTVLQLVACHNCLFAMVYGSQARSAYVRWRMVNAICRVRSAWSCIIRACDTGSVGTSHLRTADYQRYVSRYVEWIICLV